MITLITGTPGAGKTLRAIHHILLKLKTKVLEGNPPAVYSNIEGLTIPGVMPLPSDWRECPPNSLWVCDEAQFIFPCKNMKGLDTDPIISDMAIHRHSGVDLMLITQHPQLLSHHVRKFIGRHEHLDRRFGSKFVTLFINDGLMQVNNSMTKFENESWSHPKELFQHYKSASLHVKNTRIPRGLKFGMIAIVLIAAFTGVMAYNSKDFVTGKNSTSTVNDKNKPMMSNFLESDNKVIPVDVEPLAFSACITSNNKCKCYDEEGYNVQLEFTACLKQTLFMDRRINVIKRKSDEGALRFTRSPLQLEPKEQNSRIIY